MDWFYYHLVRQYDRVDNKLSSSYDVTAGVLQGGILSLLISSIFITPLLFFYFVSIICMLRSYRFILSLNAQLNNDLATIHD